MAGFWVFATFIPMLVLGLVSAAWRLAAEERAIETG
jgi:hypothetical protein